MKSAIQVALNNISKPKLGIEITSYMQNVLRFRGLLQPQIETIFKQFRKEINQLNDNEKYDLADSLMKEQFGEDKRFGLMVAEKIRFDYTKIKKTEEWFLEGFIKDWGTSDIYCSRVLKNFVQDKQNAKLMIEWSKSNNLWMRRSSCVGFIFLVNKNKCDLNMLFDICQENIIHQERFNQLGTGWLLRELSQVDLKQVIQFIERNLQYFSSEGLRYAYEKMKECEQDYLRELLKQYKKQKKGLKENI
ncbi:unnamed protein product [Paramecium sonneborni]|uniref:DNA alkylation repair protein n=1 Tax=Paramecium sonneborni TaxID=65129 RepID=A0A8S1QCX2_9CILI|nr:unnamed protein product [Paramecium sonneborni]